MYREKYEQVILGPAQLKKSYGDSQQKNENISKLPVKQVSNNCHGVLFIN
jgi:hypothetical protein